MRAVAPEPTGRVTRPGGFERFNLRHLRYFLAVCESGSFGRAAGILHIAQSAVSRRIANLEQIFQVHLFERSPRGLTLTGEGAILKMAATSVMSEIEGAHRALALYSSGQAGLLRVGLFGTTSRLAFVPELISRFRKNQSRIQLDLSPQPLGEIDESSLALLDLAFFENRQQPRGHASAQSLFAGHYMLALPQYHPLARLPAVPFSALLAEPLILFPSSANPDAYELLMREAARSGMALNIIHEAESECSRLAFAGAGVGIALVSPLAINHDQHFDVQYRPLNDLLIPFELWLSRHEQASPAAVDFAATAGAVLKELPSLGSSA